MTEMHVDDLFDESVPTEEAELDATKQYIEELVGEGKKFKTAEDLARSKIEADRFIEQLKSENKRYREDLQTRATLEELMTTMNSEKKTPPVGTDATPLLGDEGTGNKTAGMTPEEIDELVSKRLQDVERTRAEAQNLETTKRKLMEAFGNDYASKLKQVATEMGLTTDYLNQMAKTTPAVLLRLVGAEDVSNTRTNTTNRPSTSSINTTAMSRQVTGGKTKSYFDELRRTNKDLYWSSKVQNEMHRLAAELGDDFYK